MPNENILSDEELEEYGASVFRNMGLHCEENLNNALIGEFADGGGYSKNDRLELDYFIPYGDICLAVEITSRSSIKGKYSKHRRHVNILDRNDLEDDDWKTLGVEDQNLPEYGNVKDIKGVFITNRLEEGDEKLKDIEGFVKIYRSGWNLIKTYSSAIGEYGKNHFLDRVGITPSADMSAIYVDSENHSLNRETHKKVASGSVPTSSVYTFSISPYEILPYAKVYRRDNFPGPSDNEYGDYQRRLDVGKLESMREILTGHQDFMFPNNILCVLSDNSNFDDGVLTIPGQYGSISIIDGQHRLFSYADDNVKSESHNPKVMVTAIEFRNLGSGEQKMKEINKYSAITFVEINTEQTTVKRSHLDFILYDVLDETSPRALSAKVILELNERDGVTSGLFKTYQTGRGVITPGMIVTGLKTIISTRKTSSLTGAQSGNKLTRKNGYERIFESNISELENPDILITESVTTLERYFNYFCIFFSTDWPQNRSTSETALAYTKVFHALIKLLRGFINRGLKWSQIKEEFCSLKKNMRKLVGFYDCSIYEEGIEEDIAFVADSLNNNRYKLIHYERVFLPENKHIPTQAQKKGAIVDFFEENLSKPTSIQSIVRTRLIDRL